MRKILLATFIILSMLFCACVKDDSDNVTKTNSDEDKDTAIVESEKAEELEPETAVEPEEPEAPVIAEPLDEPELQPEPEPEPELQPAPFESVGVTDIKLSTYSVSLSVGEKKMPYVTMYPQNATNKGEIWKSSNTDIATVDSIGNIRGVAEGECTVTVTSADNANVSATVSVTVAAEPECTYIDGILVVNKTYPLPASYAPGWETEASGPLWEMIAAAKEEGIKLWMTSGYRSYYDQQYIYNGYVKRDGQEKADTYSARPGHSEHQTGLAYDLNDLAWDFGETEEGIWVAENCHKYGFILRYPAGKEEITGYVYEPWHIRYVGVEKATEIYESGLCLEEFLNITSIYA